MADKTIEKRADKGIILTTFFSMFWAAMIGLSLYYFFRCSIEQVLLFLIFIEIMDLTLYIKRKL